MSGDVPRPASPSTPAAGGPDILDTSAAGAAAIRGGAVRAGAYVAGVALTVGSAAVLFRHLGVEDGGRYVAIISLVALIAGITDAGLVAIGVRELTVREAEDREQVMPNLLGLRIVLTSMGIAGAMAFTVLAGYDDLLVVGALLAGLGLLLQVVQASLTIALMTRLRLVAVAALDFLRQALTVVAILALAFAGAGLLPFYAMTIPIGVVLLVVTLAVVRSEVRARPRFDRGEWRRLLRDVAPYAVATAVAAVYFRLAIIVMSLIAPPVETGYFGVSFRVIDVLIVLPQLIVGAAYPIFARAARDDRARLRYATQRMFEASVVLGAGLALAVAAAAPLAILVVGGPEYEPAAAVLRIQSVALAAAFVTAALTYVLLSLRMHKAMLLISLVGLVVTLAGTLLLVPSHGAEGAALATVAAEVAITLAAGLALARAHPDLRPRLGVVPRVAAAAAAAIATAVLLRHAPVIASTLAALVTFGLLALVLRSVPPEVLDEARAAWARVRRAPT